MSAADPRLIHSATGMSRLLSLLVQLLST
jgi:hypothetical protein